jgi:hypothetical protein
MISLKHGSHGAIKSELDLLLTPNTQNSIINGKWIKISKEGTLDGDGPVVFRIPGDGQHYLDLANSYAFFQFSIIDSDGTPINANAKVAPVNNFGHSAFQKVMVELGDITITESTNLYPYRAYYETILNETKASIDSKCTMGLFYKDTFKNFNKFDNSNVGWKKRQDFAKDSNIFECFVKLHSDMFFQERFILNNLPVKITLTRSEPKFCIHGDMTATGNPQVVPSYKFKIHEAIFYVRQIEINPEILVAHELALEKANAKYPIRKVEMKMFNINANISSHSERLASGVMPYRVVFGFVDSDSFTGNFAKTPFEFKHCNLRNLSLKINGNDVKGYETELDFDKGQTIRGYSTLFTGIDTWHGGNSINREEWENGYTLFCYDLTSDLCSGDHIDLATRGTLSLDLTFKSALQNAQSCVVYMEYQNIVEVTKDRKVIIDTTI